MNSEYKTIRGAEETQSYSSKLDGSILDDLRGLGHYSAILGLDHLDNNILLALGGGAVATASAEACAAAISAAAATVSTAVAAGVGAGVAALHAVHGETAVARCRGGGK